MFRSAGESPGVLEVGLLCAPARVAAIISISASSLFIPWPHSLRKNNRGRPYHASGHEGRLVDRADPARLSGAARLAGASVGAVASTVGWHHVREGVVKSSVFGIHAISQRRPELRRIHQDAGYGTGRDVKHVVDRSATIGITGGVAC